MGIRLHLSWIIVALAAACQPAPQPAAPAAVKAAPREIHVSVSAAGVITFNGEVVAESDLEARLKALAAQDPQPTMLLDPNRDAPYGAIARVMMAISRAGITRSGVIGGT
jgi:biopolymer transport protein ExbD